MKKLLLLLLLANIIYSMNSSKNLNRTKFLQCLNHFNKLNLTYKQHKFEIFGLCISRYVNEIEKVNIDIAKNKICAETESYNAQHNVHHYNQMYRISDGLDGEYYFTEPDFVRNGIIHYPHSDNGNINILNFIYTHLNFYNDILYPTRNNNYNFSMQWIDILRLLKAINRINVLDNGEYKNQILDDIQPYSIFLVNKGFSQEKFSLYLDHFKNLKTTHKKPEFEKFKLYMSNYDLELVEEIEEFEDIEFPEIIRKDLKRKFKNRTANFIFQLHDEDSLD